MKIAFVLDDGLDKPDGVQQYILTLGSWMGAHGHDVSYLVGQTARTDIDNVYSLSKNVKVRFNGNRLSVPLPASSRKIKKLIKNESFDVVHVQTPHSPFMAAKVVDAAHRNSAVVGTFHIMPYGIFSRWGNYLLGIWLRPNLKKFDRFISVSAPAAEFAKQTFKIDSVIVPNMVDTAQFKRTRAGTKSNYFKILFLGRLVERKGCQKLLQAMAILSQNGSLPPNVSLDICGGGVQREELEKFVADNQLEDFVSFHGFVSQEEKIHFMQNADLAVFPSLSGESFGIVLIEAMAAGSAVVLGGNNPGYESVLAGVPGSVITADKPAEMAAEIFNLINDPVQRKNLYELQQEHVKKFDVDVVASEILDIYQACINQKTIQ